MKFKTLAEAHSHLEILESKVQGYEGVIQKHEQENQALTEKLAKQETELVELRANAEKVASNDNAKDSEIIALKQQLEAANKKAVETVAAIGVPEPVQGSNEQLKPVSAEEIQKQFSELKSFQEKHDFYQKHRALLNPLKK